MIFLYVLVRVKWNDNKDKWFSVLAYVYINIYILSCFLYMRRIMSECFCFLQVAYAQARFSHLQSFCFRGMSCLWLSYETDHLVLSSILDLSFFQIRFANQLHGTNIHFLTVHHCGSLFLCPWIALGEVLSVSPEQRPCTESRSGSRHSEGSAEAGVNCGRMCWGQTWKALVRMVKVVNVKV